MREGRREPVLYPTLRCCTINIREDLHKKLKIAAIEQGTTIGGILEQLVEKHLKSWIKEKKTVALIECSECHAEISSNAVICPRCGNPQISNSEKRSGIATEYSKINEFFYTLSWIAFGFAAIAALFIYDDYYEHGGSRNAEKEAVQKAECAKALLGISKVITYVDRQAYDKAVADKCAGYAVDGKPIRP